MCAKKKTENSINKSDFELIIEAINKYIKPYCVSEGYIKDLKKLYKKSTPQEIYDAIEKGVDIYLEYDKDGNTIQDSANLFLSKLGGIVVLSKKSPVDIKIHYIKGICRNRFAYWDDQKGLAILHSYVNALKEQGWTDEDIINDLDGEAGNIAKNAKNWSEWRNIMEDWTEQIQHWSDEKIVVQNEVYEWTIEQIKNRVDEIIQEIEVFLENALYVSKAFEKAGDYDYDLRIIILQEIAQYVNNLLSSFNINNGFSKELSPSYELYKSLQMINITSRFTTMQQFALNSMYYNYAKNWLVKEIYEPISIFKNQKDVELFKQYFNEKIQKLINVDEEIF